MSASTGITADGGTQLRSVVAQFGTSTIRVTPDGRVVAIDVLAALGQKDPGRAWRELKKAHPEFQEESSSYSFGGRGRPPEVLAEEGVYKLVMVAGGQRAAQFRAWVADLIKRVRQGDPSVAIDIIERQEDPETLRWIARRADAKASEKALADSIKSHGGETWIYGKVNGLNNEVITGMTHMQIKAARPGNGNARDRMTTRELAGMHLLQELERGEIEEKDPNGNREILRTVEPVAEDVKKLMAKYQTKKLPPPPQDDDDDALPWMKRIAKK